jgi:hypothetical protein
MPALCKPLASGGDSIRTTSDKTVLSEVRRSSPAAHGNHTGCMIVRIDDDRVRQELTAWCPMSGDPTLIFIFDTKGQSDRYYPRSR